LTIFFLFKKEGFVTFEEAMREAAHTAQGAVNRAMEKYSIGGVTDEEDITGILIGQLDSALDGKIGGLTWDTTIVRHHSGSAAQEKRIGADMVIHVKLETPTQSYSKGVLIQAKRIEPQEAMSPAQQEELRRQCRRMLKVTAASFVFDYAKGEMRCASATKVAGSSRRDLYGQCEWTSYRFFLELLRCPIGDPKIDSARVERLPVPTAIRIRAKGQLSD
jgi:hypothetical protein